MDLSDRRADGVIIVLGVIKRWVPFIREAKDIPLRYLRWKPSLELGPNWCLILRSAKYQVPNTASQNSPYLYMHSFRRFGDILFERNFHATLRDLDEDQLHLG